LYTTSLYDPPATSPAVPGLVCVAQIAIGSVRHYSRSGESYVRRACDQDGAATAASSSPAGTRHCSTAASARTPDQGQQGGGTIWCSSKAIQSCSTCCSNFPMASAPTASSGPRP